MASAGSFFVFAKTARCKNRLRRSGATAVEMALLSPVFFMLLMGIIEGGMMMTAQQLMENAAYNTSRLAKTGYGLSTSAAQQAADVASILSTELSSYGTFIDTSKVTMSSTDYSTFNAIGGNTGTTGLGSASQIVVYQISYPWKLFTPMLSAIMGTNGVVTLQSYMVVRNEPYG